MCAGRVSGGYQAVRVGVPSSSVLDYRFADLQTLFGTRRRCSCFLVGPDHARLPRRKSQAPWSCCLPPLTDGQIIGDLACLLLALALLPTLCSTITRCTSWAAPSATSIRLPVNPGA
jgi:hypothetical protein